MAFAVREAPAAAPMPPAQQQPRAAARDLDQRTTRLILAAIIAAATAIAVAWALTVPIFQSPDEELHFDYALDIYSAHGLLNGRDRALESAPVGLTHPLSRYLQQRTGFLSVRFHDWVKAPPGYGTAAYYASLDADAPPADMGPPHEDPYLLARYPFGYYALVAAWIALLDPFTKSAVALFFWARLFSVVMQAPSLLLTYAIGRELRLRRAASLLMTALVAFLPLNAFVSSYVQPDNLARLLVAAALYAALIVRRKPRNQLAIALLGISLGSLLVTKYQFYVCVLLPVLLMLAVRAGHGSWLRWKPLMLFVAPSLLLGAVQLWVSLGSHATYIGSQSVESQWNFASLIGAFDKGPLQFAGYLASMLIVMFIDFYFLGVTNSGFWVVFGWQDVRLSFGPPLLDLAIRAVIAMATLFVLLLALIRLRQVIRGLVGLSRRRGWRIAVAVAGSNPVLNSYFAFAAFMGGLYVVTGDSFGAQGRNWFPFLLSAFLVPYVYAPKSITQPRLRCWFPTVVVAAIAVFCVAGGAVALPALRHRYYGNGREVASVQLPALTGRAGAVSAGIDRITPPVQPVPPPPVVVSAGGTVAVSGWAVAPGDAPAAAVFVCVDGIENHQAVYGDESPAALQRLGSRQTRAGFDTIFSTRGLPPGQHQITIKVVTPDRSSFYESPPAAIFYTR
jgi:4-amino-4-deoxy-L-arabinose transferase-like glycosyltransferase